jgi:hypothetical protein
MKFKGYYNTSEMPTIALPQAASLEANWILQLHAQQFVFHNNCGFIYGLYQLKPSFWFSTVIHPHLHVNSIRNLTGSRGVKKWAKTLVHFFQSIFLLEFCSRFQLPLT